MTFERIGVVGGGAWGTAIAQTLAIAGQRVTLWAREPEVVDDIALRHVNRTYLSGIELDSSIRPTGKLSDVAGSDVIILVPPAQHLRAISSELHAHIASGTPVVVCAKGIEQSTGKLMSEVLAQTLPDTIIAVMSGPSFAHDVARGLPTALTLACENEPIGKALATALSSRQLRLYWSRDVLGAELGGAIKNVLAIAAGIVEGRGLGASAHAAMVARGFAEMRRLAEAMGARPETLLGMSGLGDLVLTCGSPQSRNMSLGLSLGKGMALRDILGARAAVTEGVWTASAAVRLAREKGIEMPISEAVHAIIEGRLTVDDAIAALMQRPLKAED